MENTHTIIFLLDNMEIPIEKALFPESSRTLNIICNPQKYGWSHTENKEDGITYIDMKNMDIKMNVILEFLLIVRNKKITREYDADFISEMEHFAILIGAGADDCPFRVAMDKYIKKLEKIKEEEEKYQKKREENPMTPKDDIHHLFCWEVDSYHCMRPYLRTSEWSSTVPAYEHSTDQTRTCFYFRKER